MIVIGSLFYILPNVLFCGIILLTFLFVSR